MFNKFIGKSFEYFYLGFLASVGLSLGSLMVFAVLEESSKLFFDFNILTYSKIAFPIFYLFFLVYTYLFLDMKKNISLKNGFLSFSVIFIFGVIYIWIF